MTGSSLQRCASRGYSDDGSRLLRKVRSRAAYKRDFSPWKEVLFKVLRGADSRRAVSETPSHQQKQSLLMHCSVSPHTSTHEKTKRKKLFPRFVRRHRTYRTASGTTEKGSVCVKNKYVVQISNLNVFFFFFVFAFLIRLSCTEKKSYEGLIA